jgi:hypothetical protein
MRMLATFAAAAALVALGASSIAAPQQYPGQMTQAHVWVQNRGTEEAIPVDLREANLSRPLRVTVVNGEPSSETSSPVPVRPVRQTWEYRTLVVEKPVEAARLLATAGAEGWETTGVVWPVAEGTLLLLKRHR